VNLFGAYKAAIRLHNTAGVVASGSFLLWLGYYLFIGRNLLRLYLPTVKDVRTGFLRQAVYYVYYYFKGGPNPHVASPDNKFNPLQKASYLVMMLVLVPLTIVSGVLLFRVEPFQSLLVFLGGIRLVTGIHYLLGCALTAFLFAHAYLATLGKTPLEHFKPMWTGWEEIHSERTEG
jgi:thiosulfate reductase cytochrome b subunit